MEAQIIKEGSVEVLKISIPLVPPRRSGSGKSMVIASTNGNVLTSANYNGHPVTVGVNAYYKP